MKFTVDKSVIERAQKGENAAFSEIYTATYNSLYFLSLGLLKNHDDACDAVQDSFTEIIKNFSLKDYDKFSAWMCIIVSNRCKKILSTRKTTCLDEEAYDLAVNNMTEECEDFIPESALENKEFLNAVNEAVSELPLSQRNMVLLHYFSGMSTEEIGELENIPSGTVKSRLWHAREKIRQHLKKGGLIALLLLSSSMLCKALELIAGENQLDPQKAASIFSKAMESAGIPVAPAKVPTTTTTPTNTGGKTMKTIITKIIISIIAVITIAGGAVTIITINKNTDDTTPPVVSDSEYTGRTTASTASTTAASRTTTTSSSTTANGRPGATGAATTTTAGSRTTTTTTKATTATTQPAQSDGTYNLVSVKTQYTYGGGKKLIWDYSPSMLANSREIANGNLDTICFSDGVLTISDKKFTVNGNTCNLDGLFPIFLIKQAKISGDTITIEMSVYQNVAGSDKFPDPDAYPELYYDDGGVLRTNGEDFEDFYYLYVAAPTLESWISMSHNVRIFTYEKA